MSMIDCSDEIIFKKRYKRRKKRKILFVFLLFFISISLYWCFIVTPFLARISIDYAKNCLTTAVNESVLNSLKGGVNYSDLVSVEKNIDGDVSLMTVNSVNVNKLSREISISVENGLKKKFNKGTPIPFGAFSGIGILAGYGKKINVKSISLSYVESDFSSDFMSVGINHTLHTIYVVVSTSVKINYPFYHKETSCISNVLISECVIVGKIPEIYLNGRLFGI